jgi:surface protein
VVPSHTVGAVTVTVTNPDSQSTSAANFYTYRMPPIINSLTPSSGAVAGGTTVTITGTGFVSGATIMFGGAQCLAPIVNSSTSLTCSTPSFPSGTANVVVTNPDGQMSSPSIFTYMPMPLVSSVTPGFGPISGGTTITMTGTGFISILDVKIDSFVCTNLVVINPTMLTCTAPTHVAGPASVVITSTDGQSSTLPNAFIYNAPPVITSLDRNSGSLTGGLLITINGAGFMSGASVDIGGASCTSVTVSNPNTLSCVTSSHGPGPKTLTVTNPDSQTATYSGNFTYRESFVSTWQISNSNESITLPLVSGLNYDFMVEWGDGSVERITSFSSPLKTHMYTTPGIYTVTINGLVEGWSFGNVADSKLKIKTIQNFGDMGWKNLNLAFYGCSNLTSFSGGVTTQVTNMSGMFKNATSLTNLNVSTFNTSNVANMSLMFYGLSALTTLNLSNFNTSKVTNMSYMFYGMEAVTSLMVATLDTSLVTNMASMFGHTNILPSLDVSTFNTSNVTSMDMMFEQASGLTTLNLSNFNTSNVTSMSGMFNNANKLTSLNVSSFDTSKVTNMSLMFASLGSLTSIDVSNFNTSNVTVMNSMFSYSTKLASLNLSNFNTSKVTSFNTMFQNTALLTSLNVTGWDISTLSPTGLNIFEIANAGLQVICNQGGSPATGTFFGKNCY